MLAYCCYPQHSGCIPRSITIRDVPDDTAAELASRAARSGRSLQEYLRGQLDELASLPDAETWVARVRERKAAVGSTCDPAEILGHRDADRA